MLRGQALFAQAQCATCHRPSYVTQAGPFPHLTSKALNGQRIWPYTDLLLHDMGERLADGAARLWCQRPPVEDPAAVGHGPHQGRERYTRLLHDGRARGVLRPSSGMAARPMQHAPATVVRP